MTKDIVPRLCGGTFFTQLLLSRRGTTVRRKRIEGKTDLFHNEDVLFDMLKMVQPNAVKSAGDTFETYTARFKNCSGNIGDDLKFESITVIAAFKKIMADDYLSILSKMSKFCAEYIDMNGNHVLLVKRLIEIIRDDTSITNDDLFQVGSGCKANKKSLCTISVVDLPDFLLSIWEFIVLYRNDNSVGRDTILSWSVPGTQGRYKGNDGSSIKQKIKIDCSAIQKNADNEEEIMNESSNKKNEDVSDEDAPQINEDAVDLISNQVINNGLLFQQFGKNNKQIIGNVGTLIINND